MHDIAIRIEGVGKIYRIGERERYRTLRDAMANLVRTPGKRLVSGVRQPSSDGGQTPNALDRFDPLFDPLDDSLFDLLG